MTLRSRSRSAAVLARLALAVLAIVAYVAAVRVWGGDDAYWAVLRMDRMRFFLPVAILCGILFYEVRYDRSASRRHARAEPEKAAPEANAAPPAPSATPAKPAPVAKVEKPAPEAPRRFSPGHEAYERARQIPHRTIPDYTHDEQYLKLLGEAAHLGYPPALAKLGDYALRRKAWVEAYYWMWYAKRRGVANLGRVLIDIRVAWSMAGRPKQSGNVHALFTEEHGDIARALLNLDLGRNVEAARTYLQSVGVISQTPLAMERQNIV